MNRKKDEYLIEEVNAAANRYMAGEKPKTEWRGC